MIPDQRAMGNLVIEWAKSQTNVKAAWLFGSRIVESGKVPKQDSDWDVAIQVDGDDPQIIDTWWFHNMERIHTEFWSLVGYKNEDKVIWGGIHVGIHNPPKTDSVSGAIEKYGVFVYRRP